MAGFRFAGVAAGLKADPDRKDLGLIVADAPAAAAGMFTTNQVKAAPVTLAQQRLRAGRIQAIASNSGSANCFTGKAGMKLALGSCAVVAGEAGCREELVVNCSTGVIGHLYDLDKYRAGVRRAYQALSTDGLAEFAQAIMTTDTTPKAGVDQPPDRRRDGHDRRRRQGRWDDRSQHGDDAGLYRDRRRGGRAGAAPDSGQGHAAKLQRRHRRRRHVHQRYADPCRQRRGRRPQPSARELNAFEAAVGAVAQNLARQLVFDGEGATKLVTVEVRGARSAADAARVARQIANSPLVKTAFFGNDPNVGRITAAAGACGVRFDPDRLELWIDKTRIAARGMILVNALPAAAKAMREREFSVRLDLKQGAGRFSMTTCDFSFDYVKINAEYTT